MRMYNQNDVVSERLLSSLRHHYFVMLTSIV